MSLEVSLSQVQERLRAVCRLKIIWELIRSDFFHCHNFVTLTIFAKVVSDELRLRKIGQAQWPTPVILVLWEAKRGGLLDPRRWRPACPTQ